MPPGARKKAKTAKAAKPAKKAKAAKPKAAKKAKPAKAAKPKSGGKHKQSQYQAAVAAAAMAILAAGSGGSTIVKHGDSFQIHCNDALDARVYKPARLTGNHTCVMAIGTIDENVRPEADGDWHIRLRLDPGRGQEWMLNQRNVDGQDGTLVLEVVCTKQPTQKSAMGFCDDYTNTIPRPHHGDHVAVVGKYIKADVENAQHGWAELHPVSSITSV